MVAAVVPRCDSEVGDLQEVLVAGPDPRGLAAGNHDLEWHGFRAAGAPELAVCEWHAFARALAAAEVTVHELGTVTGAEDDVLPNRHYTRDIAIVIGERCLLAAPSPARRKEIALVAAELDRLGIPTRQLQGQVEFGDVFVASPELVVAGCGPRTDPAGLLSLREEVEVAGGHCLVVDFRALAGGVRLAHLDLGFNLLGAGKAIVHEPLREAPAVMFGAATRAEGNFAMLLEGAGFELLPVPAAVQEQGGTNILSLSPGRAIAYYEALEAGLDRLLARAGVEAIPVPGANLIHTGGGPRCLSMPLVRS